MKTRPHIVTQTRLYDVAGLYRNADLLAARMGLLERSGRTNLIKAIGYSRVLIRIIRPAFEPAGLPVRRQTPPRNSSVGGGAFPDKSSNPQTSPAKFRLPVLQNLRYAHRPRVITKHRAKPQKRFPAVVLWPHELDGQYVPNFQSRARVPDGGGYATYNAPPPPAGASAIAIFAPP